MGRKRLNDIKAACNLIKANRKYARDNLKTKVIGIPLFEEESYFVKAITNIICNIQTESVYVGCLLGHKKEKASPSKYKARNCNTFESLKLVEYNRDQQTKHYKAKKETIR